MDIIKSALSWFFNIIYMLIFVRVILSWLRIDKSNKLGAVVYALTEPVLGPIRSILQKSPLGGPGMFLDFSPFIAFLLLEVVQMIVLSIL